MRVVLDTNILVSALLLESSLPAQLLTYWRRGRFELLTATPQFEELYRVTRYPKIRDRLKPAIAGRLINDLRELAQGIEPLPSVDVSPDPCGNYLLAIALGGEADCMVTGDKSDLLFLGKHGKTRILSVRDFMTSYCLGQ